MIKRPPHHSEDTHKDHTPPDGLPKPTLQYRRRAWREFQRALDPLGPPKPLRLLRP